MKNKGLTMVGLLFAILFIVGLVIAWRIFTAAQSGGETVALQQEILRMLRIGESPNVNAQDRDGQTACLWAAANGQKDLCILLIGLQANVNVKDKSGRTALSYAAGNGHYETAQLLLRNKADVNLADSEGMTPLMWACAAGHPGVVELLLKYKANIGGKDKQGRTAAALAQEISARYQQTAQVMTRPRQ